MCAGGLFEGPMRNPEADRQRETERDRWERGIDKWVLFTVLKCWPNSLDRSSTISCFQTNLAGSKLWFVRVRSVKWAESLLASTKKTPKLTPDFFIRRTRMRQVLMAILGKERECSLDSWGSSALRERVSVWKSISLPLRYKSSFLLTGYHMHEYAQCIRVAWKRITLSKHIIWRVYRGRTRFKHKSKEIMESY